MILVDSCVWIEAHGKKGDLYAKAALRSLLEADEACFCGPVKLEVLGSLKKDRRKTMSAFFEIVPYLPMQDHLWETAKAMSWQLRDSGFTAPWNDILIASIAVENNCRVYSLDKHFEDIARISALRLYLPGDSGTYNPGNE